MLSKSQYMDRSSCGAASELSDFATSASDTREVLRSWILLNYKIIRIEDNEVITTIALYVAIG